MKASESLVRGFFYTVGINFPMLTHSVKTTEDWMVSRETVSLLRHLYSPTSSSMERMY